MACKSKDKLTKLYIVRHGKTDWNNRGLMQGLIDIEINDEGIKEAEKLAKTINLDDIDFCLCSPLKRAASTAEILTKNKKPIIYDNLLVERALGKYEGTKATYDLIARQWDYKLNDTDNNIESVRDCLLRAKKFLNKIKNEYPDKNILVVSHGSFIKALHFNIVGYDESTDFMSFHVRNTTLYTYEI
jgi:probable phosphoglycerate mutase